MNWRDLIYVMFVAALAAFLGALVGEKHRTKSIVEPTETKVDTLYVRDTIVAEKPLFVEKVKLKSVLVPVTDTLMLHDTLFVFLDREQVIWRDSLAEVYASGINPQVDSVKHFVCDKIVTIEKTVPVKVKSKWGIGIQGGIGAGKEGLTPYVGVGISYNLLSW